MLGALFCLLALAADPAPSQSALYLEPAPVAARLLPLLTEELGASALTKNRAQARFVLRAAEDHGTLSLLLLDALGGEVMRRSIPGGEGNTPALRAAVLSVQAAIRAKLALALPKKSKPPEVAAVQTSTFAAQPAPEDPGPGDTPRSSAAEGTAGIQSLASTATITAEPPSFERVEPSPTERANTERSNTELGATVELPANEDAPRPFALALSGGTIIVDDTPHLMLSAGVTYELGFVRPGLVFSATGLKITELRRTATNGDVLLAKWQLYEILAALSSAPLTFGPDDSLALGAEVAAGVAFQFLSADPLAFGEAPPRTNHNRGFSMRAGGLFEWTPSARLRLALSGGAHFRARALSAALPADFPSADGALETDHLSLYLAAGASIALF